MGAEVTTGMRWYVVHAYSGQEKSIQHALLDRIKRSGMAEKFGQEAQDTAAEPSPEIKVDEVQRLADVRAARSSRVELRVAVELATPEKLAELKALLAKHPGGCSTALTLVQPGTAETRIALKSLKIAPDDELLAAVDRLFGSKVCQVK